MCVVPLTCRTAALGAIAEQQQPMNSPARPLIQGKLMHLVRYYIILGINTSFIYNYTDKLKFFYFKSRSAATVWMLRYWTIIYIHINNFRNDNCVSIWLSNFQRNQSEILIIPSNFPNLKNYNKLIALAEPGFLAFRASVLNL